jgi:alpha/beta superfamily hydrolase
VQVDLQGPVGRLVGVLERPAGTPRGAALVCHPHPAHGGSLRSAIVVRTARALRTAGLATLRFNFRGVEGSQGTHDGVQEIEDAAAALRHLAARFPGLPAWAAGYSFGSRMAAELAGREVGIERLVLIAFPAALYDPGFLARLSTPGLIVMGEEDRFGTAGALRRALPEWPAGLELVEIAAADHFFRGRTPLVEEAVARYARAALGGPQQDAR